MKVASETLAAFLATVPWDHKDRARLRALDVGAGDGCNSHLLVKAGYGVVTSIDNAPRHASDTEWPIDNVDIRDPAFWLLNIETYDLIVDVRCVTHLQTDEEIAVCVNRMKKALRRGGILYSEFFTQTNTSLPAARPVLGIESSIWRTERVLCAKHGLYATQTSFWRAAS